MTKKCCSKILQFAKRRALALSFESFHNSWPTVSSWNQMRNRVRKPSKSYYHYRFLVTYNNPSRSNSFWKIGTASGISCHASAVLAWIASSLSRRESWRPQNGLTGFVWHLETFRAGIGSKKFVASAFLCMSCDDSESNLKLQALSFGQFCEGIKSCACHCLFLSLRKARDPWDGGLLSCCSALSTVERQSQSLFQSWVLSIPPTLQATIVLRKRLCFE